VTFDIDANGIVHVSAKDQATGQQQSITVTGQSALSKDEIDQMVKDAEAHAAEDRRRREEAEVRNDAEGLIHRSEKLLAEHGGSVSGAEADQLRGALEQLKAAVAGADVEAIRRSVQQLNAASQSFSQLLYQHASSGESSGGASRSAKTTPDPNEGGEAAWRDEPKR